MWGSHMGGMWSRFVPGMEDRRRPSVSDYVEAWVQDGNREWHIAANIDNTDQKPRLAEDVLFALGALHNPSRYYDSVLRHSDESRRKSRSLNPPGNGYHSPSVIRRTVFRVPSRTALQ